MGKKTGQEMEVTEYRMSMQFGICAGPVDFIRRIYVGEKVAWAGQEREFSELSVSKSDLFGGLQKEGGVSGTVFFMPGAEDQLMPSRLASKFGLTVDEMPAYRGMATAFFCETAGASRKGFYWTANTPYLKGTWIEVARASAGLADQYARIWRGIASNVAIYFALDTSTSMNTVASNGQTRLTNMKTALVGLLEDMQGNGAFGLDIQMVSYSGTLKTSIERRTITSTGYDDIIAWVNGLAALIADGTDYDAAVSQASAFFSGAGSKDRVLAFITDGLPEPVDSAADAVTTLAGISDVDVYAFNIDLADTTYTALLDNTADDGVPVVSGGDASALQAALRFSYGTEFDSNPAHIIYECLTNTTWGMGTASSQIDVASFEAAAATLFSEGFGLSMLWVRQTTIETFCQEVLDHIEATMFVNPRTGLLTLKLIRNDYDVETLQEFDPDNASILSFKRRLWGETTNEITVTWTNPLNEEDATVTAQDAGNIAIQGGDIVAASRNYYGIRTVALATAVAFRDLRAASAPIATCDFEADRSGWDLLPGDVCKIVSPEDGISQLVMRVGPIDYGGPGSPTIKVALAEDVFALALAEYDDSPETEWVDPAEDPAAPDSEYAFTLPYFLAANDLGVAAIAAFEEYPTVFAGVLASQTGSDTHSFELWGDLAGTTGVSEVSFLGNKTIIARAELDAALVQEVVSTIPATLARTQGEGPTVGGFLVIGDGDETEVELALVTAVDAVDVTVDRGVLDTTPKAWPIGTPIWFLDHDHRYIDDHPRSAAEAVDYYVLPRTSRGALALADATALPITLSDRPYLPLRPANVLVNGDDGFSGIVDLTGIDPVPVTWARRNRLAEEAVVLDWDDADVTPEAGQTATVTLTDLGGNVLHQYTGIAGTSQDVDPADFGSESEGYIVVTSERDGLESLQGHAVHVMVTTPAFLLETGDFLLLETGDQLRLE